MKIGVLLSGGIDSLYALLCLKKQGHQVIGLHGIFLDSPSHQKNLQNLKKLASKLALELVTFNLVKEFAKEIIHPFAKAYAQNLTPNPCCWCNSKIKFGLLCQLGLELGLDKIASGHYLQIKKTESEYNLFRGKDPAKEQSYFLALVPKTRLQHLIFPLGQMTKKEVSQKIAQTPWTNFISKESNEVCFIPKDYRTFLKTEQFQANPGPIRLLNGTLLGTHQGLWQYTLGQRRGLKIAYQEPLYVIKKDTKTNTLYVGTKQDLLAKGVLVKNFNFLRPISDWPDQIYTQIRYRQRPKKASFLKKENNCLSFLFLEPEEKPAPGQILAVYTQEGQLLGGGTIAGELFE